MMKVGDRVRHNIYGDAEIFELSNMFNEFADINLDNSIYNENGVKMDTAMVLVCDLELIDESGNKEN